ncbi:hypothetical protein [Thalassococcus profundi]|uniref:hypothetical protein n=1 Tax=Thalassococcus profundi TaxID=2282382 RepID=UPI004058F805
MTMSIWLWATAGAAKADAAMPPVAAFRNFLLSMRISPPVERAPTVSAVGTGSDAIKLRRYFFTLIGLPVTIPGHKWFNLNLFNYLSRQKIRSIFALPNF